MSKEKIYSPVRMTWGPIGKNALETCPNFSHLKKVVMGKACRQKVKDFEFRNVSSATYLSYGHY
jgi:hypothetical protein